MYETKISAKRPRAAGHTPVVSCYIWHAKRPNGRGAIPGCQLSGKLIPYGLKALHASVFPCNNWGILEKGKKQGKSEKSEGTTEQRERKSEKSEGRSEKAKREKE